MGGIIMICEICGRDLNTIWQDNMADGESHYVLCEDCYREEYLGEHNFNRIEEEDNEY